ncbi:MAG: tRNA pseudouridine(55) synthase TruB [Gammaproteobacteria bacterium]
MGRRKKGRDITGILLLDKPSGLTSNQTLQRAKRLYDARKAGHTGSLDPLATGLLPLCFGHATKVCAFLLDADKRYEVTARFGIQTATADAQGDTIATTDVMPTPAQIDAAIPGLTGDIEQIPPMYSALKHDGRRLYSLARDGIDVERPPRPVKIHQFERGHHAGDQMSFEVHCSKGTYIRTLVEDLAAAVGSLAHVTVLRRTQVGPFDGSAMQTLEGLEALCENGGQEALDDRLSPADGALTHYPAVTLARDLTAYVLNGQAVQACDLPRAGQVRLYEHDGAFLGLGEVLEDGRVAPRRLFR